MTTVKGAQLSCSIAAFMLLLPVPLVAQPKTLTARQVIERIQAHVGVPWNSDTVDTFKAGNPEAPVTGIAVTMMATLDVLKRAAASGNNLVITHEPTFFSHLDKPDELAEGENDPVLTEKRAFIEKHGLIIWRFHDHWHIRKPEEFRRAWCTHSGGINFKIRRMSISSRCRGPASERWQRKLNRA